MQLLSENFKEEDKILSEKIDDAIECRNLDKLEKFLEKAKKMKNY